MQRAPAPFTSARVRMTPWMKVNRPAGAVTRWVATSVVALNALAGASPGGVAGQGPAGDWPRFEAGLAGGLFVDYPSERADPYCEQKARGVLGHAAWWFERWLGVQASLTLTGGTDQPRCVLSAPPSLAPTPIDEPFQRNRYDRGDFSGAMLATGIGIVVEPARGADVSPRAFVSAGWMSEQDLPFWSLGGGVRFAFGRHALTIDGEWWNFTVDVRSETVVFRQGGSLEVLDSFVFDSALSMILMRVGWAVGL